MADYRPTLETAMLTTLIVIAVIVAVVLFVIVGAYNKLVALDQRADQSFADIDVQLKQRHDLIPNLVDTVKGYAGHEKSTLEAVTAARSAATTATSVNDKVQAENMLSGALGRLFALSEAYPDLKASTNFLELQRELSDIENKLAAARRFFNNAVSEFNAVRRQFPTVLFAAMVGFGSDKPFFDVGEADRAALSAAPPKVSFTA